MSVEEPNRSAKHAGVDDPYLIEPTISDASERARLLKEIVKEMRSNPLPANAPHLTREDFHARR
jgi:hypothetical protein